MPPTLICLRSLKRTTPDTGYGYRENKSSWPRSSRLTNAFAPVLVDEVLPLLAPKLNALVSQVVFVQLVARDVLNQLIGPDHIDDKTTGYRDNRRKIVGRELFDGLLELRNRVALALELKDVL